MKNIIFDFNGTLVNDLQLSVDSLNYLLKKYLNQNGITTEQYKQKFIFPVKDYYQQLGFDFSKLSFQTVSHDWFEYYEDHKETLKLFEGVVELLQKNREKGYRNIILSACHQEVLMDLLKQLQIDSYFDKIIGIQDKLAHGKLENAILLAKELEGETSILIGDTLHDFEVAKAMGISCTLVSNGFQSYERLQECGVEVVQDIREIEL